MSEAIDMYKVYERQAREAAHIAYVSSEHFQSAELEAKSKGFRKATLSELHDSAESARGALDLFSWRGGLWVKIDSIKEQQ